MENQQEQAAKAKLQRTSSVDCEPKTLTKEQYGLARAAAAMQAFEEMNRESAGMSRPEGNEDLNLMKDELPCSISGLKLPAV